MNRVVDDTTNQHSKWHVKHAKSRNETTRINPAASQNLSPQLTSAILRNERHACKRLQESTPTKWPRLACFPVTPGLNCNQRHARIYCMGFEPVPLGEIAPRFKLHVTWSWLDLKHLWVGQYCMQPLSWGKQRKHLGNLKFKVRPSSTKPWFCRQTGPVQSATCA